MVRSPSNLALAKDLYETYAAAGDEWHPAWDTLADPIRNRWLAVANRAIELAFQRASEE